MGEKKADNVLTAINQRRQISLKRFIYALGIPLVGETMADVLAQTFGELGNIQAANIDTLVSINAVGPLVAKSIVDYFASQESINLVNKLLKNGVIVEKTSALVVDTTSPYHGKKIVITGSFQKLSRADLSEKFKALGAKVSSSVSKNTDFLIVGENAGSKLEKAQSLGVTIIEESQLPSL
jgi:NAD-dependent DNA ligase (contains BRCT domain type II)